MENIEDIRISPITFEDIYPIWQTHLWPNRKSIIEPVSAIVIGGGYSIDYMKSPGHYWGAFDKQNNCVGVISGFETEFGYFRVRGVWVSPQYRFKGLGTRLLREVERKALREKCHMIWTMGRIDASDFYKKSRFLIVGTTSDFEGGPHFWFLRKLGPPRRFYTLLKRVRRALPWE